MKGFHTYSNTNRHTITTTVLETGNSPVVEGGNKVDVDPATLPLDQRDLVRLPDSEAPRGLRPNRAAGRILKWARRSPTRFCTSRWRPCGSELLAGGRSDAWADWFEPVL